MTEISKILERLSNPQPNGVKELTPICENILKFFLWSLTFIPFLNTWLDKQCENLLEKGAKQPFKAEDLTQLKFKPDAFPSYYPRKLVEPFKDQMPKFCCERIRRHREAPQFSLCYAELPDLSNKEACKTALKESVQEFCEAISKDSGLLSMGRPNQTHPLPLSSDFLDACSEILPTHFKKINALHINGPIKENTDQNKLQAIIEKMEDLKTIYLCPEFFECCDKPNDFLKQIQVVHVTPANVDEKNATSSPIILEKREGTSTLKIPSNLLNACRKALPTCFKNLQHLHMESMDSEKESSHLKSTVLPEYLNDLKVIDEKPPAPPQKEGSDEKADTDVRSDPITIHLPSNFFEFDSKLSADLLKHVSSLEVHLPVADQESRHPSQIALEKSRSKTTLHVPFSLLKTCISILPTHFKNLKEMRVHGPMTPETDRTTLKAAIEKMNFSSSIYLPSNFFESFSNIPKDFFNTISILQPYIPISDTREEENSSIIITKMGPMSTLRIPENLLPTCRQNPEHFKCLRVFTYLASGPLLSKGSGLWFSPFPSIAPQSGAAN